VCGKNPTITAPIDYEQFCGVPALDPLSLEETKREVQTAKAHGQQSAGVAPKPDPSLDAKGLPPAYPFKPDWEITPREVKAKLDKHEPFVFIDCRLPNEAAITKIEGATLLPVQQLMQRLPELKGKENEQIIVHCKSGGRSMTFTQALRQQGFKNVKSMAGGILLWNKDINPGGPQY
jgi:adenylyltransferase/sulfurtransferase